MAGRLRTMDLPKLHKAPLNSSTGIPLSEYIAGHVHLG